MKKGDGVSDQLHRQYNIFKTKTKILFWSLVFKSLAFGLVYGMHIWVSYNKSDLKTQSRLETIPLIIKQIIRDKTGKKRIYRNYHHQMLIWASEILKHFLTIDNAYSYMFEEFIRKYYRVNYEGRLLKEC